MYYKAINSEETFNLTDCYIAAIRWALKNSLTNFGHKEDYVYHNKYEYKIFETNSVFSADEADDLSAHFDNLVINCCFDDCELKKASDFFYKASCNGGFKVI